MKCKTIGALLFSVLFLVSCKQEADKTTETIETKTIEKETVIVKDTVKEADGTSVKVSSDGVDVNSKDVKIEVKK